MRDRSGGWYRKAGKNALCGACAADVCTVGWIFLYTKRLYGVALFIKKKSQRFNRDIAIAFENEGEQHLVFEENSFHLNEKQVSYDEVVHLYELKKVFSIIYQGNHVYILPKAVMEPQQTEQFVALMKEKVSAVYEQRSK